MSQDPTTQGSEVKSEIDNPTINVKVVSSSGEEVFFKIKRSTKLSKLQGAYASKVGKDVSSIRFLYDGARINDEDTPASLDMEDNGAFASYVSTFVHLGLIGVLHRHYRRDGRAYVASLLSRTVSDPRPDFFQRLAGAGSSDATNSPFPRPS
ncbi:ubiquitin-related domain-containing protein [Lactarius deliciosus]|nr:ubiquitin-related domain-containing protein [Lactarius deliciosus]